MRASSVPTAEYMDAAASDPVMNLPSDLRFAAAAFALKHTVPGDVLACGEMEISDYSAVLAAETPALKADIGGEL